MTEELQVEATGETVGEAKWAALRELEKRHPQLDKSSVQFQVVTEGERGLLGVGYAPARVIASAAAASAAVAAPVLERDESERAAQVRDLVERVIRAIGVGGTVEIVEDAETITATCDGPDLGMLIGRHGQTIDSVQYLANAIQHRRFPDERLEVVIDAAGYRARRRETLEALAVRSAEQAIRDAEEIDLEPMTAVERKVIHLCLKEFEGVETSSEGTEPNRYVVIYPV